MEAGKQEKELIKKALDEWQASGLLTPEKVAELDSTIQPVDGNAKTLSQYFFFIAISCILLAFGAIFIDDKLLEKVKHYFAFSNLAIAALMLLLSAAWFWFIIRKRRTARGSIAYETYMIVGGLCTLCTLAYICKDAGFGQNYTGFLITACLMLCTLSVFFSSLALWVAGLAALMGWFGAFSTIYSHDYLFLGMNYPLRFSVFGLLLLGISFLLKRSSLPLFITRSTYLVSMVIFFTALWGLSIFGNYSQLDKWSQVHQVSVLAWSLLFGAAALASFLLGINNKDDFARDMGLLFLLLNLYTRYFEYFWDSVNKGIFFLILAVSFFFIGRWLEKKKKAHGKILS